MLISTFLSKVRVNLGLEDFLQGAHNLADLLAVLEDQEGGQAADAVFLSDVEGLIDVYLEEGDVGVLRGHLVDGGRDRLTWGAPIRVAVDDSEQIFIVEEFLVEFLLRQVEVLVGGAVYAAEKNC